MPGGILLAQRSTKSDYLNKSNRNQIVFTMHRLIWNTNGRPFGSKSIDAWLIQSDLGLA